jgi:hypothetical protein
LRTNAVVDRDARIEVVKLTEVDRSDTEYATAHLAVPPEGGSADVDGEPLADPSVGTLGGDRNRSPGQPNTRTWPSVSPARS